MPSTARILSAPSNNPRGIHFADLVKCVTPTSEIRARRAPVIESTGRRGLAPRVNIQNAKGMANPYQVRQVIKAIKKLEGMG